MLSFGIWTRLRMRWHLAARSSRPKRRQVGEVLPLEPRQLLFFSATISAAPQFLLPPNGRYVPVVISGTFTESRAVKPDTPVPPATYFVVDDYRVIQPRGPIHLTYVGGNTYSYAFTLKFPAQRASTIPGGRHYYVNVAAHDADGWSGSIKDPKNPRANTPATLAVWVPISASQIGRVPSHASIASAPAHSHPNR